jgi:hypothetical protein
MKVNKPVLKLAINSNLEDSNNSVAQSHAHPVIAKIFQL